MDPSQILIFIILVALSAFFSGTEIALMTLSKHTIETFKRQKRWGATSLDIIRKDTDTLLITILIGNNLVNVGASALATATTLALADNIWLPWETWLALVTWVVTLILLMFGEITPKTICIRYASTIALLVSPLYRVLIVLLRPISYLLGSFVQGVSRVFGANGVTAKISNEEVSAFIDMSHNEWAVEADERRQIKNLLALSDITAESVMTPRVYVEFLSLDMTIDEACTFFVRTTHSRIPVYGETTDDIDYLITFREAFKLQREGHGSIHLSAMNLEKIMKVPLTQALDDLFEKFQKSRRHIALVLDEHGGTAGVVTMEDVLEEVFGDIKDEKDKEEIYMRKRANGNIEAVGTVLIDDILEEYNISPADIALPSTYQSEPLSYILLAEKEEFVHVGTSICFVGEHMSLTITILETDEMVIEKVLCEKVDTNK